MVSFLECGRFEADLPAPQFQGHRRSSGADNPGKLASHGFGNAYNWESSSQPSLQLYDNAAVAQQPVLVDDDTEDLLWAMEPARDHLTRATQEPVLPQVCGKSLHMMQRFVQDTVVDDGCVEARREGSRFRDWVKVAGQLDLNLVPTLLPVKEKTVRVKPLYRIKSLVEEMVVDRGFVQPETEAGRFRELVSIAGKVDLNFVAARPGKEEKIAVLFFDRCGEKRLSHGIIQSLASEMVNSSVQLSIMLVLEGDGIRQKDTFVVKVAREKGMDAFSERDVRQAHKAKSEECPVMILQPDEEAAFMYFFGLHDSTQMMNRMSVDDYLARYFGLKEGQIIKLSDEAIPQLDQFYVLC